MKTLDRAKEILSRKIIFPKIAVKMREMGESDLLRDIPIRRIAGLFLLIMLVALAISASDPIKPGKTVDESPILSLIVGGWVIATILNNLSMIFGHKVFVLDVLSVALFLIALLTVGAASESQASGAEYSGFTNLVGTVWIFGNVVASIIDVISIKYEL